MKSSITYYQLFFLQLFLLILEPFQYLYYLLLISPTKIRLKRNKKEPFNGLFFMERETRLELATSSLARRHSTTELPPHIAFVYIIIIHAHFLKSSHFLYFIRVFNKFVNVYFLIRPYISYLGRLFYTCKSKSSYARLRCFY